MNASLVAARMARRDAIAAELRRLRTECAAALAERGAPPRSPDRIRHVNELMRVLCDADTAPAKPTRAALLVELRDVARKCSWRRSPQFHERAQAWDCGRQDAAGDRTDELLGWRRELKRALNELREVRA